MKLTRPQRDIARAARKSKTFVEGVAGSGKTTAAVQRLAHLLDSGVDPASILVIVPQQTLAFPYRALIDAPDRAAGGEVTVTTLGGLARRACDLFWPLVAEEAGFGQPQRRPTFLSLETAQYFMAQVAAPLIEREGRFDTVTIDRSRLYSQLIDNLNKAAVVGFPHEEIAQRLKAAWTGDSVQLRMYDDVQTAVDLFRAYCLQHNLLDFSLQVTVLLHHLWPMPPVRDYFTRQYRHLIVENIEEDTPATHFIVRQWLNVCESALLLYDLEAGYRRFLGADPVSGYRLREACERVVTLNQQHVTADDVGALARELALSMEQGAGLPQTDGDARAALSFTDHRYHPEMLDWIAAQIAGMVHDEGIAPGEIVVLAPFLSDALRFSLENRLAALDVPVKSHRPSRPLRSEAAVRCLLTLAQLAHPQWRMPPAAFDVTAALLTALDGLDLVRAKLLAQNALRRIDGVPRLLPFDQLTTEVQQRVTYVTGERYDHLRAWLDAYIDAYYAYYIEGDVSSDTPGDGAGSEADDGEAGGGSLDLDHFFSRLFGEALSQPGFGFHNNFDAATQTADLIDSARKFRWIITESGASAGADPSALARDYVAMVGAGIIADQYLRRWDLAAEDAVLLAPAYTFLMSNRPVDVQVWLNVGGRGWTERLYQPLTNPYVLSLQWEEGRPWTDHDEVAVNTESLYRLAIGLLRRCRQRVVLGFSELGEQGYEQRGELLDAFQRMLRRLSEA